MKGKILLVDDSDSIVRLVAPELQAGGYQVYHAEDADAAFSYLKRDSADLVLLDIELPGISGLKLLEILKQDARTAGVPVIMLTLHKEESSKLKGLEGGADDYVTKPFSPA
ncbi:MAG: response regulator, partial [Elusimicrobia bacterium]|nr:response regulator [Elusimicrobiota bacterium]